MSFSYSLEFILEGIGDSVESVEKTGDYAGSIEGFASLSEAREGDLSFFYSNRYKKDLEESHASVIIVPKGLTIEPKPAQLLLAVENPSLSFAMLCREVEFNLMPRPKPGIHPSAVVHPTAVISPRAYIGPLSVIEAEAEVGAATLVSQVTIGRNARVGDDTLIGAQGVVGAYCIIGNGNRLSEGCVIGSDGYGYLQSDGKHERIPQIGIVETASHVDIGANSTVDRARLGRTFIDEGTKVDNLVQIAHNVQIGKHCLLIAQSGIAGSSQIKDHVILAAKSGIAGHLSVGANSIIGPLSGVYDSLEANSNVIGVPATSKLLYWRVTALSQKLPKLFERFNTIESLINKN